MVDGNVDHIQKGGVGSRRQLGTVRVSPDGSRTSNHSSTTPLWGPTCASDGQAVAQPRDEGEGASRAEAGPRTKRALLTWCPPFPRLPPTDREWRRPLPARPLLPMRLACKIVYRHDCPRQPSVCTATMA